MLRERSTSTIKVADCLVVLVRTIVGRSMASAISRMTINRSAASTRRRPGVSLLPLGPNQSRTVSKAIAKATTHAPFHGRHGESNDIGEEKAAHDSR